MVSSARLFCEYFCNVFSACRVMCQLFYGGVCTARREVAAAGLCLALPLACWPSRYIMSNPSRHGCRDELCRALAMTPSRNSIASPHGSAALLLVTLISPLSLLNLAFGDACYRCSYDRWGFYLAAHPSQFCRSPTHPAPPPTCPPRLSPCIS